MAVDAGRFLSKCALAGAVAAVGFRSAPLLAQNVAIAAVDRDPFSSRRVTVHADDILVRTVMENVARQAKLRLAYDTTVIPQRVRITMHATDIPVADAFRRVLDGTRLVAQIQETGTVLIVRGEGAQRLAEGAITGTVIDAKTRQPLRGATVLLDGMNRGVRADENGRFRFPTVSASEHSVTVRLLGYARLRKTVIVEEGQTATIELALDASQNTLDQVVVTGTVVATELKAVPNAITVITAKQLEQRGVTRIDQLFRGDVPGLFAMSRGSDAPLDGVIMYSRGTSSIGSNSTRGSRDNTNPIKTYVDGVELANPQYLSQIDPRSIERIEILTGPQASTIYGSNALNGVMQIFTKRGSSTKPRLTAELMNGWVQSNFSKALTPYQDYTSQVSGVDAHVSYNGGGSWNYIAPWSPSKQTTRMGGFGGVRLSLPTAAGTITSDVSYRRSLTRNRRVGRDDQTIAYYKEIGWYEGPANDWASAPVTSKLKGETFGMTMGYMPVSWWSHELSVGQDYSDEERLETSSFRSPSDTSRYFLQDGMKRRTLRYSTTMQIPLRDVARVTVTAGGDSWQDGRAWISGPGTLALTAGRTASHNAGGFLQGQVGVLDHLFLTYGLRAEWNPWFGKEAMPAYAPRYGISYSSDFGPMTAKIRASYGRSTRPPSLHQKYAARSYDNEQIAVYGPFDEQIANPALGPEHQQGGEGGVELYFGSRASLVVTRYNQTVDGLVTRVLGADSVKSIVKNPTFFGGAWNCARAIERRTPYLCSSQDADGYGYRWVYQNINAASIRNQGWEMQGNTTFGPLTARATYSWTKSRVIGVTSEFRAKVQADQLAAKDYKPGRTFGLLPEHTGAMGLTYARARTSLSLNAMWTGALRSDISAFKTQYVENLRLMQNRVVVTGRGHDSYIVVNPGYTQMDLIATHQVGTHAEALLQIQNLTDLYPNDYRAWNATMGRQTKVGVRLR